MPSPGLSFHQSKGWVGQLIETMLGTDAANRSEPDFVKLGIELKTIPIDRKGRPKETRSYVLRLSLRWEHGRIPIQSV